MKKAVYLIVCFTLILFSCKEQVKEKSQEERTVAQYSIEQFMDNESAGANGFSADKSKVLITSNRSGINNMYSTPVKGGELTPITQSDSSSIYGISYFPKDDRILFSMDGNGDEIFKIFMKDENGIKALTPLEGVRTNFRGWAKDGKSFFYGSNERDPQFLDHYEMNIEDFSSKIVYKVESARDFNAMSDDGKYITLSEAINTNDSDLYIVNTETNEQKKVNATQSGNGHLDFSPDGKTLYFSTDEGAENSYVASYDIATGTVERVTNNEWPVFSYYFTHNGKYNVFFTNEDAKTVMKVTEVATGKTIEFPEIDGQSVTSASFSRDESMALLRVGNSAKPTNMYAYDMNTKDYYQLTDVLNKEINADDLVEGKVVRFNSFDGVEVPAIYYQPKQANANNKVPAIVMVHGGPGGQSRLNFSSRTQFLVNHGYAVLAVNNRGSSGYGKTFYMMDNQNHGDKDLKDCIAGKDWLAEQEIIDADKIGIMGGSYGGFMTMAALTSAPEEFKVGVNYFGVTNWMRTLKSIPPWWASFKDALYEEMGDPHTEDSIRLKKISPLFHTDKVTKPLLVLQGAQDPRVLQVESDEIVEGVRQNGVPVEYVLFEDEGHGFVKKENQIEATKKVIEFLDQYLKGDTSKLEKTDL
ncbi:peptidase S9 [Dokdonia pacifica]|uniref:Dipeptidyl aminopeptidase/acylaminoacyl peptidase n=1 Tax=Dokdonia pacifica TaxID=1627892 RepID=A0A238ZN71_9FLAO|nr:S9 family peptidase [Dokdonia pacifica]GGG07456.1 peptidase S9 [Dokdonia pacifica]SNR84612.1 Dipeptidyl aminopeptidase/acylaminoacyl peptidase [Dokdonia pacifica]